LPGADAAHPAGARKFKGIAHDRCSGCHTDPHGGTLGATCTDCHSPAGWKEGSLAAFDHGRTGFPLRGRHRRVACRSCHGDGPQTRPLPHENCSDCHRDVHSARPTRARAGRCLNCHDEDGFNPARFTLASHDTTGFPLRGAHRAVPCVACHAPVESASGRVVPLKPAHAACTDCHADPHGPSVSRWMSDTGCVTCHGEDSWRGVAFDHDRTGWRLSGRHAQADCRTCHRGGEATGARGDLVFAVADTACASCHADAHRGQFTAGGLTACCERCHQPGAWNTLVFDHERDSAFALTGTHARLACNRCHPRDTDDEGIYVRYRPLGRACADCHADVVPDSLQPEDPR
jgi:hypothetical protein